VASPAGDESGGNGWRAQQADALIAIAKAYLAGGDGTAMPVSAADHYQVVVHVDDSALRGGLGRSDLPIDTVKRLTCDGSLITVVEDDGGTPVDAHHIRHWAEGGDTSLSNLTLLCSHHHRLLHEGGFKIRREHDGAIYFQRADGRVIPRFGYRLDDMRDESATAGNPSAEVRESAAVYSISAVAAEEFHRRACH